MTGLKNPWAKLGLLGSLYFSQGLPFGFFTQALPVMLRERGFTLSQIGLTSLLAIPWALKFLWAPTVDRLALPGVGRRKSWIVPLQLTAVAVLTVLALAGGTDAINVLMGAVFLLNLIAATQDIATDGLAVEMLDRSERGIANGIQVAGYRVGMIVGGGALLILYEELGDTRTFLAMAALTALATLPILLTPEKPAPVAERGTVVPRHFLRRPGAWQILLLVVTYKAGDAFGTAMLRPYLSDIGLSVGDVGWLLGTAGFAAGLVGAVLGGALVNPLGRQRALVVFGILQALTVGAYAWLAAGTPSMTQLYAICAVEHLAGGMATAALFTCMMDWCSSESSGTDYTVQASAVVIATGAASAIAGFSADALGYTTHFALAGVLALAAVFLVHRGFPGEQGYPAG